MKVSIKKAGRTIQAAEHRDLTYTMLVENVTPPRLPVELFINTTAASLCMGTCALILG